MNERSAAGAWANWRAIQPKGAPHLDDPAASAINHKAFVAGARWMEARMIATIRRMIDADETP